MKTKLMMIVAALTMVAFAASGAMAADLVLTVSDAEIAPGGTGTVTISVNDATGLAGAAFTMKYADPLSVTNITSDFFDTFVNQGFAAGQDGLDENGMVDSYDTPLVTAEVTDVGMRVAAARATGGEGTDVVLFTLEVSVDESATEGATSDIQIISTTLNNTDAGYAAEGEQIDLLIADDFTVLLSKKAADEVVADGTVTAGVNIPAGLPEVFDTLLQTLTLSDVDTYELTTESDFDGDGYTDVVEYENRGLTDVDGKNFDPIFVNAADESNPNYIAASRKVAQGDLDKDGDADMEDVRSAFRIAIGLDTPELEVFNNANVYDNQDGQTSIVMDDVRGIFRLAIGLDL